MDNRDYLEYEGSRLLDYAIGTFQRGSSGDLINDMERVLLAENPSLSLDEQDKLQDFFWEYVLFRLYITSCMIHGFHDGFGSRISIVSGMESMLHSIPAQLKMISLERDLAGSYLLISRRAYHFHKDYVDTQFAHYQAIEQSYFSYGNKKEGRLHSITASLSHIAALVGLTLTPGLTTFLQKETLAYMKALSHRLEQMTPEGIHERAHHKTLLHTHSSIFSKETYDHLYPSFTLLASMAAGLLYMFA